MSFDERDNLQNIRKCKLHIKFQLVFISVESEKELERKEIEEFLMHLYRMKYTIDIRKNYVGALFLKEMIKMSTTYCNSKHKKVNKMVTEVNILLSKILM